MTTPSEEIRQGYKRRVVLDVDFLEENADVKKSPRGWGEASVNTATVRSLGDVVEFKLKGKRYRVTKEALKAMLELESGPPTQA